MKKVEKWNEMAYQSVIKTLDAETPDEEELSESQKNRLSKHIKQDVALAFYAACEAYGEARTAKVYARLTLVAAALANVLLIAILVQG